MAEEGPNFELNFQFSDEDTNEEDLVQEQAVEETRFKQVSEEDVKDLISSAVNPNTKRKTRCDLQILTTFMQERYPAVDATDIADLPQDLLVDITCKFLTSVKRIDGTDYETTTLRGIAASIDRHLASKGRPRITAHPKVDTVLKSKLKLLKRNGKGNMTGASDALSDEDVDLLWKAGQLGTGTPSALQNLLWWNNTIYFGMRSVTPHRAMKWGDVELKQDAAGRRYLEYNERATKTRTGVNAKHDHHPKAKAYENEDDQEKCPVEAYLMYKAQRPDHCQGPDTPFYLSIFHRKGGYIQGDHWFKNQPVGLNTLGKIMKKMASAAGLGKDKRYTNHSARKTMMQKMADAQLNPTIMMQVSGHKNIQSINNYSCMSETQRMEVSRIFQNRGNTSSTITSQMASTTKKVETARSSTSYDVPSVRFEGPIYGGVFNFTFSK